MPSTNDTRTIKINANNPAKVVDFDASFSASFDSELAIAFEYSDNSSGSEDLTIRAYVFSNPATGVEIGRVSIEVKAFPELSAASISVDRSGRSTYSTPPSGRGESIAAPGAQNVRRWEQAARRGSHELVKNVARVDLRSVIPGGRASQTVRQNDEQALVIGVELGDAAGIQASGTVTLSTAAVAGRGFSLGPVQIIDEGGAAGTRTGGGGSGRGRG